jgi:hypothetical protein
MKKTKIVLYLIAIAFLQSCNKAKEAAPAYKAPDSSYGLIYDKIFTTSCALSGCHADETHSDHGHSLTLKGEMAYSKLFNIAPQNSQALAAGLKIVAAGDTAKSFLYQKIIYSRSAHKYGAPMPTGGLKLTNKQIEFVKLWITAGAPKDGHVVDKNLIN